MSRSLLLSSLLVLTVGCAGAGSAARMGQHSVEPMVVSGTAVTGPSSSLALRDDGMRGRFRNRPVALQWDYQRVTGSLGGLATKLELSEGDDTRASGTLGGAPVALLLKDDVMLARVGMCAYYTKRVEGGYAGKRDCDGVVEDQFFVDFPESLQERPLGQMATLLTLTLASYTETYDPAVSMARFVSSRSARIQTATCKRLQ